MIYISKGIVKERSTESLIRIHHCGRDYQLTGLEAAIWFDGRYSFCSVQESWATEHLYRMGLIEKEQDDTPLARYRLLSRCICCHGNRQKRFSPGFKTPDFGSHLPS